MARCPDCGKLVPPGTAACPDCGYPFVHKAPQPSVVNGTPDSWTAPPTGSNAGSKTAEPAQPERSLRSSEEQYQADAFAFVAAPNGVVIVPLSLSHQEEAFPKSATAKTKLGRRPFKLAWMRKLIVPAIAVLILSFVLRPQPLTYHVASIDPRFGARQVSLDGLALPAQAQDSTLGLPKSVIESILQDAANRWNIALKKTAVRISTGTAGYAINFVFDYRQEYQNSITSIDDRYSDVGRTKVAIDQEESSLGSQNARLDEEYASLNRDIAYWNSRGGATGTTYGALVARRKVYDADVRAFNNRQTVFNQEVAAYNTRVAEYKKTLAQAEETFELAGGSPGENFVGIYDPNDRSITIYSYSSSQDLRLILLLELGHALGCGHASTPGSVMYPELTDAQNLTNPVPTAQDLALVGGD